MFRRLKAVYNLRMFRLTFAILLSIFTDPARATPALDFQYQQIRTLFQKVYAPVVQKESNLQLEIKLDSEAPDYFGGMMIEGETLVITIGSRAHHDPTVTPDSYMALLCHEVGHRLGGPPFKNRPSDPSWSSAEGQSDFYAASVCLKKVYSADAQTEEMSFSSIPQALHDKCETSVNGNAIEKKICLRVIKAGKEMAEQIHSIYLAYPNPPKRPDLMSPEPRGQSFGFMYPSLQCRMDTFIHGALKKPQPDCWLRP